MIDDLLWGLVGWWVVMIRKSARSTNPIGVVIWNPCMCRKEKTDATTRPKITMQVKQHWIEPRLNIEHNKAQRPEHHRRLAQLTDRIRASNIQVGSLNVFLLQYPNSKLQTPNNCTVHSKQKTHCVGSSKWGEYTNQFSRHKIHKYQW